MLICTYYLDAYVLYDVYEEELMIQKGVFSGLSNPKLKQSFLFYSAGSGKIRNRNKIWGYFVGRADLMPHIQSIYFENTNGIVYVCN